jgi:membrane-associated protein
MELIKGFIDLCMHLDIHLADIIRQYGSWTYAILFTILFCETGLVITPFLPGDSLLFAAGVITGTTGALQVQVLLVLLGLAAILGDTINYWIGYGVGPKIFQKEQSLFLNKRYLEQTHQFYKKYGGKTIILARFMPIIRTFAPFVAGIGRMRYAYFFLYNAVGGVAWVASFLLAGYFFGNLPLVKKHFEWVLCAIIFLSVLPSLIEVIRHTMRANKSEEGLFELKKNPGALK